LKATERRNQPEKATAASIRQWPYNFDALSVIDAPKIA